MAFKNRNLTGSDFSQSNLTCFVTQHPQFVISGFLRKLSSRWSI
jgi:hypothetical protein